MTARFASALAVVFAVGLVTAACSSSSDPPNTTQDGGCTGSSSGSGSAACGSCVQAHCSAQYNACFGSGGACASWVNTTHCQGLPDSTCQGCILGDLSTCQKTNCSTECKSGGTTDAGGTTDTGSGGNCAALAACCPSIDADAGGPESCNMIASGGIDAQCSSLLSGYKAIGYCK